MGPNNIEGNSRPLQQKNIFLFIGAILFFGIVFGSLFIFDTLKKDEGKNSQPENYSYGGNLAHIADSNEEYRLAVTLRKDGNYLKAIQMYEEALKKTSSLEERAQIEYEIGATWNFSGDPITAIRTLKKVVENPQYPRILRADAVQLMGEVFYWRSDRVTFDEIFKDEPYRSLLVPGKINTSLKNLFEYASSIYPLAYAELRAAQFYAAKILNVQRAGLTVSSEGLSINEMKSLIRQKIINADRDVENIMKQYPTDVRIYNAQQKKAIIAGLLYLSGDDSFGDPIQLYEDAYRNALVQGYFNQAAFTLFNFASFLVRSGTGNEGKIKNLLTELYTSTDFKKNTSIFQFLKNEEKNVSGAREDILLLAQIDPGFKDFLISLGWKM